MDRALALSGETPSRELVEEFNHIGLVRSEYLFRNVEIYPTADTAQLVLYKYLMEICAIAAGKPIWFRTLEVTTREANTLRGVEEPIWDEPVPMMGLRGVRRAMRHPASLEAELMVLGEVHQTYSQLGVVAPFVTNPEEFAWFYGKAIKYFGECPPVACMVEIPSAVFVLPEILSAGAVHVIVGTNDLSSFLLARSRATVTSTEASPALDRALVHIRDATAKAGATMTVAGYLTDGLIASAERAGSDFAAMHYCDLPRLLGPSYAHLPELDRVQSVKRRTRAAISLLEQTL